MRDDLLRLFTEPAYPSPIDIGPNPMEPTRYSAKRDRKGWSSRRVAGESHAAQNLDRQELRLFREQLAAHCPAVDNVVRQLLLGRDASRRKLLFN
jgi:hypothetical protein